jgi:hypothetical protein
VIIKPAREFPYLYKVRTPYSPEANQFFRSLQGAWFDGEKRRVWMVPREWGPALVIQFPEATWEDLATPRFVGEAKADRREAGRPQPTPTLRAYQELSLARMSTSPGGFILSYSMKLGKSAPALRALSNGGFKYGLIICPAASRPQWEREAQRWLSLRPHGFFSFDKGKLGKKREQEWALHCDPLQGRVTVISYGMVGTAPLPLDYDFLIIDELHYLAYAKSKQSKAVAELLTKLKPGYRLGLTGTPLSNDAASAYNPLETIFPRRYGVFFSNKSPERSYAGHYTNVTWNGWGHEFSGLNDANAPELRARLELVSHRVTKKDPEVAALFPRIQPEALRKPPDFEIAEVVKEEIEAGNNVAIMCASQATWLRIEDELARADLHPTVLSGAESPEKRDKTLQAANERGASVVVASIAACAVTIDLSHFDSIHFLEYTEKPAQMVQVMGRNPSPKSVTLWYDETTIGTARRLEHKFEAMAAVMEAGTEETAMREAFSQQTRYTQAEWMEAIDDALMVI